MTEPTHFSPSRLGRLIRKELRETLRDRRTIITLVLMPVLVYPLLGVTFQKFFLAQFAVQDAAEVLVAFESDAAAARFREAFSRGNRLLGRELEPGMPLPPRPGMPPEPNLKLIFPEGAGRASLEDLLQGYEADLGIRELPPSEEFGQRYELISRAGSANGEAARDYVEERFRAVNDEFVRSYLRKQPQSVRLPIDWSPLRLTGPDTTEFSLATLVPLVLILMTVTGAVYPAIDLTAGERERGTLEALIAAPIDRRYVLIAKYVAVVTVALLTAVMNLLAMIATAYGTGLEKTLFGSAGLSWGLLLQVLGLLGVYAGFFSAVILGITSIARSFKEAQAYLIPVMLLSLAPGVLALMPGLELTTWLAVTPLINIVVLTRDLLDGRVAGSLSLMVLGSSVGYAAIALSVAARIFGTDSVLYGSSGTWSELFERPPQPRARATWSQGLLALGLLLPAYLLLGGLPARLTTWSLSARLGASALITVLLFAVWPILLSLATRVRLASGLGLVRPAGWAWIGAALAGCSLWPFAYELEVLTISAERLQKLVELFRDLETELSRVPLVWRLMALAVVPAVCEELCFRGYLFRAFQGALGSKGTIVLTATLFGLFHVLVRDALLFERFLPTAGMGLVLGWVAWRSGSVLPGMLLHVVHNGSLLLLPVWGPMVGLLVSAETRTHLPWPVLCVAGVAVILAVGCLLRGTDRAVTTMPPQS